LTVFTGQMCKYGTVMKKIYTVFVNIICAILMQRLCVYDTDSF